MAKRSPIYIYTYSSFSLLSLFDKYISMIPFFLLNISATQKYNMKIITTEQFDYVEIVSSLCYLEKQQYLFSCMYMTIV